MSRVVPGHRVELSIEAEEALGRNSIASLQRERKEGTVQDDKNYIDRQKGSAEDRQKHT